MIFLTCRLIRDYNSRRIKRLAYDGEVAVGQELQYLTDHVAFHDFQAGTFNIDHILVGASGVYAVETKARSKPDAKDPMPKIG